jgi:hypothetical protein
MNKQQRETAKRRAMADWMANQNVWQELFGRTPQDYNPRAWERIQKNALIDEQSAMISEVNGRLYMFPQKKITQAMRDGIMLVFQRQSNLGFRWDDAVIWTVMRNVYRELRRMKRTNTWAKAPVYNKFLVKTHLKTATVDDLVELTKRVAISRANRYIDVQKKAPRSEDALRNAIPLDFRLKHNAREGLDTDVDDRDPSESAPAEETEHTVQSYETKRAEKPALAIEPITVSAERWNELQAHPPFVIFATNKENLGKIVAKDTDLEAYCKNPEAFAKHREYEGERRARIKIKVKAEATVETATYLYHRTFKRVKLIRHLADGLRTWVVVRKAPKPVLVDRADLQTAKWPKEKKSRKKAVPQVIAIAVVAETNPCIAEELTCAAAN